MTKPKAFPGRINISVPPENPHVLIPYLSGMDADSVHSKVVKLKGALTNVIYKVSISNGDGSSKNYLVRIYGAQDDSIVNRDKEFETLSRLPPNMSIIHIIFCFNNGRVEEFYDNYRHIKGFEMRDRVNLRRVAHRFKELHQLVPLTEEEKSIYSLDGISDGKNNLGNMFKCFSWDKLLDWIEVIDTQHQWASANKYANIKQTLLCPDWLTFKNVIHRYRSWLIENDTQSFELVRFCHNDAQHGNIMLNDALGGPITDLVLIDFEYAGAGVVYFDIANFFSECMHDYDSDCSYVCDGSKFPTSEDIMFFLRCYFMHLGDTSAQTDPSEEDLKRSHNSIIRWRASAQLFWGVWAILQSGVLGSHINKEKHEEDFNYLMFCRGKMAYFWGDMLKLGIVSENECIVSEAKYLQTGLL